MGVGKIMCTKERFEAVNDDFLKFELVEKKLNHRPDLHAWIFLDLLFPNPGSDIVCAAAHDEIWLDVSSENIAKLTDKNILELTRCGVRYDAENESLAMFT